MFDILKKDKTQDELFKIKEAIKSVNKVFLGNESLVNFLMIAALSSGHVLLDDVPGVGKTTLAKAMAAALGLSFKRVQFTSDIMPSDITGGVFPVYKMGVLSSAEFKPGPIFSQILLADEVNRAPPRTQSSLLEAMAEKQVSIEGETIKLDDNFWVIATQNPIESHGVFPLPDSQLDRFLFKLKIGYPSENFEKEILSLKNNTQETINPQHENLLNEAIILVKKQFISDAVTDYLYRLILATRTHQNIITGLSPRAGVGIMSASQASSWLAGRAFVSPEDVQNVFRHAAAHRISVASGGYKAEDIVEQIISDCLINVK